MYDQIKTRPQTASLKKGDKSSWSRADSGWTPSWQIPENTSAQRQCRHVPCNSTGHKILDSYYHTSTIWPDTKVSWIINDSFLCATGQYIRYWFPRKKPGRQILDKVTAYPLIHRGPTGEKIISGHKFFKISGQFQDILSVKNISKRQWSILFTGFPPEQFFSWQKNDEKSGH